MLLDWRGHWPFGNSAQIQWIIYRLSKPVHSDQVPWWGSLWGCRIAGVILAFPKLLKPVWFCGLNGFNCDVIMFCCIRDTREVANSNTQVIWCTKSTIQDLEFVRYTSKDQPNLVELEFPSDNFASIINKYQHMWHVWRPYQYINSLVQERCNSIANTLELRLSCTNPLICGPDYRHESTWPSLVLIMLTCFCLFATTRYNMRVWIFAPNVIYFSIAVGLTKWPMPTWSCALQYKGKRMTLW